MPGEDIAVTLHEMITKHGYEPKEAIAELRRSHSESDILRIVKRPLILRDHSVEAIPLDEDVANSDLLSEFREQIMAELGLVSEQQAAANVGYEFSLNEARRRKTLEAIGINRK